MRMTQNACESGHGDAKNVARLRSPVCFGADICTRPAFARLAGTPRAVQDAFSRSCCDSRCRWGTNRLPACEGLDDEHRRATVPADEDGLSNGCGLIGLLRLSRFGCNEQQLARSRQIVSARGIGEQPIVTDAMKAAGQNMQQEAAHELLGTKRHRLVARFTLGSVVLPTEAHPTFIESDPARGWRSPHGGYSGIDRPAPRP